MRTLRHADLRCIRSVVTGDGNCLSIGDTTFTVRVVRAGRGQRHNRSFAHCPGSRREHRYHRVHHLFACGDACGVADQPWQALDALAALRTGGVAADRAGVADAPVPLTECLDSYFSAATDVPPRAPVSAPPDTVLDQLPPIDLAIRRTPIIDVRSP